MTDRAMDPVLEFADNARRENAFVAGARDLRDGLSKYRLWTMLAWNDIRQRYRRSIIGPFWITISMGLFIALLGVIYAKLFHQDIAVFLPYIAAGIISWGFVSSTITEGCNVFLEGAAVIQQIRLPYSVYPLRLIWRGFLIYLHTIVLFVPILFFFPLDVSAETLLFIPGMALIMLNQVWVVVVVGVLSTRFRDVVPIIGTIVPVAMIATPIMWPVHVLHGSPLIYEINPFYHMIEITRAPLLGELPALHSYLVVLAICIVGHVVALYTLGRASRRIAYWL
jgi:ABC-type polysaccharide/polyol phosphate export permease